MGNSIVKDVKGWKLSDDKNKVVVKHFRGAKTKDMESYIISTLEQNPETIIIHSGTNDLKSDSSPEEIARDIIKLTTSCKTQTNKVILSSIVPRYDNLNEKATRVNKCLKKECEARNICFIDHRNISPKYNCNRSGLHLNYSGIKKLLENILFCLYKSDWQTAKVGMNFRVSINANKEKANQESKTVNSSSKSHSRNYSNRQNKKSARSVLTVSSDTPCDTLNGLHEQRLNHPKNVIIGHLNINSIRNKFSGFKDLVLKETDICLLPETKIDDSFPNSQFFAEGYRIFRKDINKNGGGLILYINEDIPGKLINSYNFKEGSEIIVFEFSI